MRVCSTRALAGERVHGRSLSRPFIVRIRCRRDLFFQRTRQRHFQISEIGAPSTDESLPPDELGSSSIQAATGTFSPRGEGPASDAFSPREGPGHPRSARIRGRAWAAARRPPISAVCH